MNARFMDWQHSLIYKNSLSGPLHFESNNLATGMTQQDASGLELDITGTLPTLRLDIKPPHRLMVIDLEWVRTQQDPNPITAVSYVPIF